MRFLCVLLRYILLVVLCLWLVALPCLSSDVFLCLSGENQPRLRRRNESFSNRAVADAAQARAYLSPSVLLGTLRSVLVQRDGTVRAWFAIDTILKMPPSNNDTGEEDSVVVRRRSTRSSSSAMSSNNDTGEEDSIAASRRRSTRASAMSSNNYTRLYARRDYVSVPAVRPRNWSSSLARDAYLAGTPSWTVVHNRHPPHLAGGAFRRITRTLSKRPEDTEVVYYSSGNRCVLEVNQDNLRLGSQYVVFGGVPSERHSWPSLTASALPIPNDKRILRAVKKVLCKGCAKPPSIEGLQNVKVEEGSKARLRCHLAGNPIPWVEWFKDGKKITTRGRIRVKTKRRTSRLVIRRARVPDRGVYECRAGNIVQKEPVSATASLVVTRKRRKPTTQPATTSTSTSTQSSPWTTEPCRVTDFCNNGGTCVFYKDVQEYVCHCAEGYVGLRCDYKDVRVSVGEVKNMDPNHGRLLIIIVILFLIFFCLNWASLGICWLCCFRNRITDNWGKFREMAPLRRFFKKRSYSKEDRVSVNVAMELASSQSSSNEGENKKEWNSSSSPSSKYHVVSVTETDDFREEQNRL